MVRTWLSLLLLAGCTSPVPPTHDGAEASAPPSEAWSSCMEDTVPVMFSPPTMWATTQRPFPVAAKAALNLTLALGWDLPGRPMASAMGILLGPDGDEAGRVMVGIDGPADGSLETQASPGNWTLRLETQNPMPGDRVRLSYAIRIESDMECP